MKSFDKGYSRIEITFLLPFFKGLGHKDDRVEKYKVFFWCVDNQEIAGILFHKFLRSLCALENNVLKVELYICIYRPTVNKLAFNVAEVLINMFEIHLKRKIYCMPDTKENSDSRELYKLYASRIDRQDNLINQRLGWMLTSQGFMFAAVGVMLNSTNQILQNLAKIVTYVGISVSIIGFMGAFGAWLAIHELIKSETVKKDMKDFPRLIGGKTASFFGFTPAICIPIVLFFAWLNIYCCI